jgi:hypothetical protein
MHHVGEMTIRKLNYMQKCIAKFDYLQSEKATDLIKRCFDPYINRPLLGNAPVRKTRKLKPAEAINNLIQITEEVNGLVCNLLLKGSSIGRICRILNQHANKSVNILSRSLIVLNLYFEDKLLGRHDLRHLLVEAIRQWCHIPETLIREKHFQAFLNRLAKPMYDTMKLLTLNRNRQRAYIEAVMLQDWISLQAEAQLVDAQYRKDNPTDDASLPCMSYFALFILIDLLDRHLSSAISLNLFYEHHDIAFAYWYRHYLLSAQLNQFSSMRQTRKAAKAAMLQQQQQQQSESKRGKKKNAKKVNGDVVDLQDTPEDSEDEVFQALLGLKRMLCSGILRFIAALRQAEILKDKTFEFTTFQKIFEKRFEVYQNVRQPPPLSYEDYLRGSDFSRVSKADLLQSTLDLFQACKATVEKMLEALSLLDPLYAPITETEARALLKVCVGNIVYLHRLQQIVKSPRQDHVAVVFDFASHDEFCTIKLS